MDLSDQVSDRIREIAAVVEVMERAPSNAPRPPTAFRRGYARLPRTLAVLVR